jgi:hypothetical protein
VISAEVRTLGGFTQIYCSMHRRNVVSESIEGRLELQKAKDDLEAVLPTIDPACDHLKRMIKTPDTPYSTRISFTLLAFYSRDRSTIRRLKSLSKWPRWILARAATG